MKFSCLNKPMTLIESRKPSTGIWYYVYLKPEWKLFSFKHDEYGDMGHVEVWQKYIAPMIAKHYGISEASIAELYYSMPRGRVENIPIDSKVVLSGEVPGHWYLYHGNDTPGNVERAQRTIINDFDLNGLAARGLVHFTFSPHETMNKEDKAAMDKLIGDQ